VCDVERGCAPLVLGGPPHVRRGCSEELVLTGANTLATPALVHAAVTIDRMGSAPASFEIERQVQEVSVEPGQAFELRFGVRFATDLPRHLYHAKGLAVVNGGVSWALKKIEVR
jgi:hypothetical protein